ncbi:Piso0_003127 [Millerozyma farinosa CBS 7064]|uniref:Piso0_003127 protein n=1 Tax=Pichia sorbitophila (strain ATCC MYA-4447 / BCRC 22081 / CBS 7064 / NBRC 10061 / NRRL Y-12695) TaxID=559304 RepID=G8YKF0_PICSO|nr:Piso0_003127 [Millerozyma farinosa CBS 7064]CCE80795.1 Piso0_003127 [Millerozyma farinosa CBS 7064]
MSQEKENPLQVVDITAVDQKTAEKTLEACTSQGFLFIEGHGISQEQVDELFALSKLFFQLEESEKTKHTIDISNHGYTNYGGENLDPSSQKKGDPKEAMNFACLDFETGLSKKAIHDFFHEDPRRIQLVQDTTKKLYALSIKILQLLALGLKIEDTESCKGVDWFTSRYDPKKDSGSTFRFLHYPGQKSLNPEAVIRAGAHTDYGSMTLLFQKMHEEGLEIYSPVYKKWQAVPFVAADSARFPGEAPPIVVNIADQLSYWTAGLLKSTIHRVKFPKEAQESGRDRYSIVFFSHPNDDTLLEPVPSELIRSIANRGANVESTLLTAKQHLDKRLASTYGFY